MTIFDVIRYPISDEPTEKELANLPPRLFHRWASTVFFPRTVTPAAVERWYKNEHYWNTINDDIRLLREMIAKRK